jgi:hypothetical protein
MNWVTVECRLGCFVLVIDTYAFPKKASDLQVRGEPEPEDEAGAAGPYWAPSSASGGADLASVWPGVSCRAAAAAPPGLRAIRPSHSPASGPIRVGARFG